MSRNSLRSELRRGVVMTATARYSDFALALVVSAILARILTPAEFGTVAVVTVLLAFFKLVGDAGLGPAVIQWRELTPEDESAVFTLSVVLGVVLSLFFALGAPMVARVYSDGAYLRLVPAMALALAFNVWAVVPQSLLRKRKRFGLLGVALIVSHAVGGAVGIWGAIAGWGAMALVVKSIVSAGATFLSALVLSRLHLRPRFRYRLYKAIARYSGFQFLFQAINYFSRNLDKLLVGHYLGQANLGYYDKSYRLMMLPLQTLTQVITPVLHPVLASAQGQRGRVFGGFLRISELLALIGFPLGVFLHFSAHELVLIVFGEQWIQSVPVFSILAWSVGLQMVLSSTGSFFQVSGKTDLLFYSGALSALFMVGGIVVGLAIGSMEAVATALVIAFLINFFQGTWMLVCLSLQQSYTAYLAALIKPLVIAGGVLLLMFLLISTIELDELSLLLRLLIKSGLAASTFAAMVRLMGQHRILLDVLRR